MTTGAILAILLVTLIVDGLVVIVNRRRFSGNVSMFRAMEMVALVVAAIHCKEFTPMVWCGMSWAVMAYNTWFLTATDDDLCEFGPLGRKWIDHMLDVHNRYERYQRYEKAMSERKNG